MAMPRVKLEIGVKGEAWGAFVIELDQEKAPGTVANFLRYVDDGFYDGTIFHRIISTFMIQGGGQAADGSPRKLHPPVKNEASNGLTNERGSVAMARTSDPHSATSQFFVNVVDNSFLDHPGRDGWGYCVFGRVVEGLDIVDRIKDVPVGGREKSTPNDPPVILAATRVNAQ